MQATFDATVVRVEFCPGPYPFGVVVWIEDVQPPVLVTGDDIVLQRLDLARDIEGSLTMNGHSISLFGLIVALCGIPKPRGAKAQIVWDSNKYITVREAHFRTE